MKKKILITCVDFRNMTGSVMYFLDLATALVKLGHDVSLLSNLKGSILYKKAQNLGVKCYDFTIAPQENFDVILASHKVVIEQIIDNKLYESVPIISINHSEIIPLEYPVIDNRIVHYIAIRDSIAEFMEDKYFVPKEYISVIHNPINTDRLLSVKRSRKTTNKEIVVFPATIDYLRKNAIISLAKHCIENDYDCIFIGDIILDFRAEHDELNHKNISFEPATWDIRNYYNIATKTSGIKLGRTEIEGYFFGINCLRYDVDNNGQVLSMKEIQCPAKEDVWDKYNYISVAKKIEKVINTLI